MGRGVIVASALACAVALPSAAQAVFPGRNGLIAYVNNDHDRSGLSAIVTVQANGHGRRIVHRSATGDDTGYGTFEPAWSPRGDRLAFEDYWDPGLGMTGSEQIYVSDARGSRLRQLTPASLTHGAVAPSWSPDGTRLAFSAGDIYTIHSDGTRMTQLTHDGSDHPDWLKTGRIAFQRGGALYTMRPDGSNRQRVALAGATSPSWSPLGRNIVFVRRHHVFIARSDGSHQRALTSGRDLDASPGFSPDGRWVVFTRTPRNAVEPGPEPSIWVVDIHAHHAHRVLREPTAPGGGFTAGAYDPAWQPLP